jgi:hypothetical protein
MNNCLKQLTTETINLGIQKMGSQNEFEKRTKREVPIMRQYWVEKPQHLLEQEDGEAKIREVLNQMEDHRETRQVEWPDYTREKRKQWTDNRYDDENEE